MPSPHMESCPRCGGTGHGLCPVRLILGPPAALHRLCLMARAAPPAARTVTAGAMTSDRSAHCVKAPELRTGNRLKERNARNMDERQTAAEYLEAEPFSKQRLQIADHKRRKHDTTQWLGRSSQSNVISWKQPLGKWRMRATTPSGEQNLAASFQPKPNRSPTKSSASGRRSFGDTP